MSVEIESVVTSRIAVKISVALGAVKVTAYYLT
jgi:hypothetical protein